MKTVSGKDISKIGIGSYGVGGRGHRDMEITEKGEDKVYVKALTYTLKQGVNFSEIALGYGHGQSLRLFKRALDQSGVDRRDIFLTHSLYPRDLATEDIIQKDVADFYTVMDTSYADSTLVTESLIRKFGQDQVFSLLHQLLTEKKSRYVSLSNARPEAIQEFHREFGESFCAHEGHLSFEIRVLQDKGIFDLCNQLGVTNIIWRPLRRGKTSQHNWDLLRELAETYERTQNQIVLNWMSHLGYHPMVMSTNKKHIDENIAATDFLMSNQDYQRLTDFRPKFSKDTLDENDIVTLANDFEKYES